MAPLLTKGSSPLLVSPGVTDDQLPHAYRTCGASRYIPSRLAAFPPCSFPLCLSTPGRVGVLRGIRSQPPAPLGLSNERRSGALCNPMASTGACSSPWRKPAGSLKFNLPLNVSGERVPCSEVSPSSYLGPLHDPILQWQRDRTRQCQWKQNQHYAQLHHVQALHALVARPQSLHALTNNKLRPPIFPPNDYYICCRR